MPVLGEQRVDPLLTNHSQMARNKPDAYIADMLYPLNPTDQWPSAVIPGYVQSDQFRDLAKELAPRAETEGSSYGTSTDTYTMREWGFHDEISDPELDSFQEPYDAFRDMTDFVTDMIWKRREVQVATRDFVTGVWGTDLDGGSTAGYDKWDDVGANPLEQIIKMMDAIEAKTGHEGNTAVIGKGAWVNGRFNPALVDTIKHTQMGVPTLELVKSATGLDKMVVGKAIITTSPKGTAEGSVSYTRVWGKHLLVTYSPGRPTLRVPAAGYTYVHRAFGMGGQTAFQRILRHRIELRRTWRIEAIGRWDCKRLNTNAGAFLENVTD